MEGFAKLVLDTIKAWSADPSEYLKKGSVLVKILLIEDMRTERTIIKRWLEVLGYDVIEASNGAEGIERYYDHRPDLVITDIVMPEKEGIEMMIDLRKDFPDIKIFAISGAGVNEPGEFLHLAKYLGAQRTFTKPLDKVEFCQAVMEILPVEKAV